VRPVALTLSAPALPCYTTGMSGDEALRPRPSAPTLGFAYVANFAALSSSTPLFALYLSHRGFADEDVSALLSAVLLVGVAATIGWTRLADAVGSNGWVLRIVSLGAIVAMSLPARALIAVEPLLSTDQLWPLHRTIRNARARGMEIEPAMVALFDRPFTWTLERIGAPTLVLAGSEPLLPERDTPHEPSLLTDEDFAAYAHHPLVEAHRIAGGHTLLDHNPAGVMAASRDFMLRHGYLPAPAVD